MKKFNSNLLKVVLFLLVVVFTFSVLTSCGKKNNTKTDDPTNPTDDPTIEMAESYKTNRANFKAVTGIELPALEKLEVDEYPYTVGDTSYCFDIISGDNLNYGTYQTLENFFKQKLGNCDEGYPTGDEATGRDAQWTKDGRWYQTYWDNTNKAIYINTNLREPEDSKMTDSYRQGRKQFYDIVGIWLPELENIELLASSAFSTTYQTACFDFKGDKVLFDEVLAQLKSIITEKPLMEDSNGAYWEFIIQVNGRDKKINIDISYDPSNEAGTAIYINGIIRDYYDVTLQATTGGTVSVKLGSKVFENNVAHITAGDNLIFTATPNDNYSFVGWYIGTELLNTSNPYTYIAEKKDVTVIGKFEENASNMEADYKEFKTSFNQVAGILLPELESVNIQNKYITIDNDNHVRDEIGGDLVLSSKDLIGETYNSIKALFNKSMGNPSESISNANMLMDQWSIPFFEATIPYRVEAMMVANTDDTKIDIMWRKQPIVIINVSSVGPGAAYGVYINSSYEEVPYTKYWEIVDAFHGTLVATPDTGKEFVGWYVNDALVSKDERYVFSYKKEEVTFTEITFVAKFQEPTPVVMTDSYAQARISFKRVSGLALPELATVTGMFEDLGSSTYMVDIANATTDTLASVIKAFDDQTNTKSTVDAYGKNVYNYTRVVDGVTYNCELSCFYDSNIVVIMYQETLPPQMTDSYVEGRKIFKLATEVDLPDIADLEADIAYGPTYVMFDIVSGTNLTKDTYDDLISYLDNYGDNWFGSDETQSQYYPTKVYTNLSTGASFQVVWNGESSEGGIYLNVTSALDTPSGYNAVGTYLTNRYGITLPEMSNISVEFSCAADSTWMTFDMTKETSFTESDYNQFVEALKVKLGNGTSDDDEYQKRTTWTVDGLLWDVTWDLTTGIAINFSKTGE